MEKEIAQIDEWLKATGMAESRLGSLACANARVVGRIRNGTATIRSLEAVLNYIKQHPEWRRRKRNNWVTKRPLPNVLRNRQSYRQ